MRTIRSGRSVVHDCAQSTLHEPADPPSGDVVAQLSLTEAAAWLALERSARERAPISTSLRLTYALLSSLEARGIISVDIDGRSNRIRRSIYDPVAWTRGLIELPEDDLEAALRDQIVKLSETPQGSAEKLALWRALAFAEAESYLATQLRKHGFDATWSWQMMAGLEREWSGVPLARRRYLIWASVRQGASTYMQSGGDMARSFGAIQTELRRRGRWLAASASSGSPGDAFLPYPTWTRPLLLDVYLSQLCEQPDSYWTAPIPQDSNTSED